MNRRGVLAHQISMALIAIIVLVIVFGALTTKIYGGPDGLINAAKNVFPNFKQDPIPSGSTLVGIDIETDHVNVRTDLFYHTGSEWEMINFGEGDFNLSGMSFDPVDVRNQLEFFLLLD